MGFLGKVGRDTPTSQAARDNIRLPLQPRMAEAEMNMGEVSAGWGSEALGRLMSGSSDAF